MIKIIERYFKQKDDRGSLEGIINHGEWREMNIITSSSGSVRGNHYHKQIVELFIILDGEITVVTQEVRDGKLLGDIAERDVTAGDVFLIEPFINHTFYVRKDSRWINALSRAITKSDPDIHRIEKN
ncbi:MAG: cupin domain-containing protein [Nitrospinae bacterium]|nr:cupin domain-containing protein [Nitrospinota bacterium]